MIIRVWSYNNIKTFHMTTKLFIIDYIRFTQRLLLTHISTSPNQSKIKPVLIQLHGIMYYIMECGVLNKGRH